MLSRAALASKSPIALAGPRSLLRRNINAKSNSTSTSATHFAASTALGTPARCFSIRQGFDDNASSSSQSQGASQGKGADYKAKLQGGDRAYEPNTKVREEHPIVQLPARTLWSSQYALSPAMLKAGDFDEMIGRVKAARHYYQYPSLSAPQIGWNVQMFTLFDDSVYINPVNLDAGEWRAGVERQHEALRRTKMHKRDNTNSNANEKDGSSPPVVRPDVPPIDFIDQEERHMARLRQQGGTCFAWEPCASCCFLMHYIERPTTLRLRAMDVHGVEKEFHLDGIKARFALHEMDHLNGILFTRRVVDTDHVVPLEGFNCMSDWSDDYPSLEARSTFLYTTFTPPYTFRTESVDDANLLDRKFEDGIYPGCEHDRQMRIENVAFQSIQRDRWRREEDKGGATVKPAEAAEAESSSSSSSEEKGV